MKTGKHKVKEICDILRQETLEPARAEAEKIIRTAEQEADQIIHKAKERAEYLLDEARKEIDEERRVFQSSLALAAKQVVASLKEEIENKLFSVATHDMATSEMKKGDVVAAFISAMVKAIEKGGIEGDLTAEIPASVTAKDIAAALAADVKKRLGSEPVVVKELQGGARIKVEAEKLTLDMSDETVKELLSFYARDDFRSLIFG
ncbi:MAG: V-type ATP synthase subunit E [Simkaniaceae bacterium]|nr:V-type ATP synthase subunit E [Simkaniaceae bacterium]